MACQPRNWNACDLYFMADRIFHFGLFGAVGNNLGEVRLPGFWIERIQGLGGSDLCDGRCG